jgi:NAD-dependent dihydropyrimidine dehydrogenase PreA subunit
MSEGVYRRLAEAFDKIPPGLEPTESCAELQLLERFYTPEQAALASLLGSELEPAGAVASRAGLEPQEAERVLGEMAAESLVGAEEVEGEARFRLLPFIGAVFEEQVHLFDEEIAQLFERYYQEARGFGAHHEPPFHRVIPVEQAVPVGVEIAPYEQVTAMLKQAKSWGVRPCACRLQQQLLDQGCGRPIGNCVVFSPDEAAFEGGQNDRPITLDEALAMVRASAELGLVHTLPNFRQGFDYVCSCCTCCCFVLRGLAEFAVPTAVAHSAFRIVTDSELCEGCGDCVERCQFQALSLPEDVSVVDHARCVGCGSCVMVCPADALRLERKPDDQVALPSADPDEWTAQRAAAREVPVA